MTFVLWWPWWEVCIIERPAPLIPASVAFFLLFLSHSAGWTHLGWSWLDDLISHIVLSPEEDKSICSCLLHLRYNHRYYLQMLIQFSILGWLFLMPIILLSLYALFLWFRRLRVKNIHSLLPLTTFACISLHRGDYWPRSSRAFSTPVLSTRRHHVSSGHKSPRPSEKAWKEILNTNERSSTVPNH